MGLSATFKDILSLYMENVSMEHWYTFTDMWCHIETLSALLAFCEGNLPVSNQFPFQMTSYAQLSCC